MRSCRPASDAMRGPRRRFIRRRHRARWRAASIAAPRGPRRSLLLGLRRPIAPAAAVARAAGEALQVDRDLDAGGVAADAAAAALQTALPLQGPRVAVRVPVAACEWSASSVRGPGGLLRHRGTSIATRHHPVTRIPTQKVFMMPFTATDNMTTMLTQTVACS